MLSSSSKGSGVSSDIARHSLHSLPFWEATCAPEIGVRNVSHVFQIPVVNTMWQCRLIQPSDRGGLCSRRTGVCGSGRARVKWPLTATISPLSCARIGAPGLRLDMSAQISGPWVPGANSVSCGHRPPPCCSPSQQTGSSAPYRYDGYNTPCWTRVFQSVSDFRPRGPPLGTSARDSTGKGCCCRY